MKYYKTCEWINDNHIKCQEIKNLKKNYNHWFCEIHSKKWIENLYNKLEKR